MSLLYIDDIEMGQVGTNLNEGNNKLYYNYLISGNVSVVPGVRSEKQLQLYSSSTSDGSIFSIDSTTASYTNNIIFGFDFCVSSTPTREQSEAFIPNNCTILSLQTHTDIGDQLGLHIKSDWSLGLGTLTTPPNTISDSQYHYIELQVDVTNGNISLWVDEVSYGMGVIEFDPTIPIRPLFGSLYGNTNICYQFYDNIYVLDLSGTTFNTRLGKVKAIKLPLKEQIDINFIPSNDETNINIVNKDDLSVDSYVHKVTAPNKRDEFKVDASGIPVNSSILAVQQSVLTADLNGLPKVYNLSVYSKQGSSRISRANRVYNNGNWESFRGYHNTSTPSTGSWNIDSFNEVTFGYGVDLEQPLILEVTTSSTATVDDNTVGISFTPLSPMKDLRVDFGDGTIENRQILSDYTDIWTINHTYPQVDATYTITIYGLTVGYSSLTISGKYFNNVLHSNTCVKKVIDFGNIVGSVMFTNLQGLISVPPKIPPGGVSLFYPQGLWAITFDGCINLNDPNIAFWDVSGLLAASSMFKDCAQFNQPVGNGNFVNLVGADDMFNGATSFNQDISNWCVPSISTKPLNFDTNTPNWDKTGRQPEWGTCPQQ